MHAHMHPFSQLAWGAVTCCRHADGILHAQVHDNGERRALMYHAACSRHGEFLLDRAARFPVFLAQHGACNPHWAPLTRQPREPPEQHARRLQALFPFEKTADTPVVPVGKAAKTPGEALREQSATYGSVPLSCSLLIGSIATRCAGSQLQG